MGKFGHHNHVSLNILDTSIILMGVPKVGKTTLLKEVYEKVAGENGYMFLEMYREKGASHIEGINYENVETWSKFDEIVTDIEENIETYPDLKTIIIDTWDSAIALAEIEAIRIWNKNNPDEQKDSISAIYGGWQRGLDKAGDLLDEMTIRLENVGIKVNYIMHIKNKEVQDPYSDRTYQLLTSDIAQKYFGRLKRNIDLIAVAYIDRTIVTEKTGKKDIKGKDITKNIVKEEVRKIKFRDSSYVVDAGGRLPHIVEEIPFSSDDFIKAIEDALKKEVESSGISLAERKKEDAKNEKASEKKAIENSKAIKEKRENYNVEKNIELIYEIKSEMISATTEVQEEIKKYMKENGFSSFKNPEELPTKCLENILSLLVDA